MKTMRVMDDPRLDRAYTQAYYAALRDAQRAERAVALSDQADAFASLFEQELESRDLSPAERARIVRTFREHLARAPEEVERNTARRRRIQLSVGGGLVATAVLVFLLYLGVAHPFASIPRIQAELQDYREKVAEGYGGYASRYYRTLDRYDTRMGLESVRQYESEMRDLLDQQFALSMQHLREGDAAYLDDALQWASRYPEPEERQAHRQEVQNVALGVLGEKVTETVDNVVDRVNGWLQDLKPPKE